jgi:hypothetical protein
MRASGDSVADALGRAYQPGDAGQNFYVKPAFIYSKWIWDPNPLDFF